MHDGRDDLAAVGAPEIPKLATRWTPEKVEFRLRREGNLDPIEGLWRDSKGQFAIVYDEALDAGEYVAFRFSYQYGTRPGETIALIRPVRDGTYNVHYQDGNGGWRQARALLNHETAVLAFDGIGWQRTTNAGSEVFAAEPATATTPAAAAASVANDPLAPRWRDLGNGSYYLALPSFAPRFEQSLNELIETQRDALAKAQGLIIDLRGNNGGGTIYETLSAYLHTGPVVMREDSAILASERNTQHVQEWRKRLGDEGRWLDPVIARMRANPGKRVAFADRRIETPRSLGGPRQVVILQDRGVSGAAEAFLLQARQSSKVVTMGEATLGSVDYEQPASHDVGCGEYALAFSYPLIMRTRTLPEGSLNDGGIAPDVRLSSVLGDWTGYADRWLRSARRAP